MKGVLRVLLMSQYTATDAKSKQSVTLYKRGERDLIPLFDETPHQLSVWRGALLDLVVRVDRTELGLSIYRGGKKRWMPPLRR